MTDALAVSDLRKRLARIINHTKRGRPPTDPRHQEQLRIIDLAQYIGVKRVELYKFAAEMKPLPTEIQARLSRVFLDVDAGRLRKIPDAAGKYVLTRLDDPRVAQMAPPPAAQSAGFRVDFSRAELVRRR